MDETSPKRMYSVRMAQRFPTADVVYKAVRKAERTNKWVAEKAGIALSTFNRKLAGHVDFTVSELMNIAKALGIPAHSLLPAEFHGTVALAA